MKILFSHPNMPGQYKHLCRIFAEDKNNQVVFLTKPKPDIDIPNVLNVEWETSRDVAKETHRYLIPFERGVITSQETWRACKQLRDAGFIPDVVVGHLGWGDGLFIKDIFPDTPVLAFMEFFYNSFGADVNFLPGEDQTDDDRCRLRAKNAIHTMNLTFCDWAISPTQFQLDRHPDIFHPKISMLHDGIDTDVCIPGTGRSLTLPNGVTL